MTVASCCTSSSLPSSVGALESEHSLALAFASGNPVAVLIYSVAFSGTLTVDPAPWPRLLRRTVGDAAGEDSVFEIEVVVEVTCDD